MTRPSGMATIGWYTGWSWPRAITSATAETEAAGGIRHLHRRLEHDDLGASAALGRVERRIGLGVELGRSEPELGERRQPARERQRLGLVDAQGGLEGLGQQSSRDSAGAVKVGMGEEDGELVAADAEGAVGATQRGVEQGAEAAQDPVAVGVAAAVVDRLELVDVDEHQ